MEVYCRGRQKTDYRGVVRWLIAVASALPHFSSEGFRSGREMVAGPEQARQVQAPGDFFFDQSGMEAQGTAQLQSVDQADGASLTHRLPRAALANSHAVGEEEWGIGAMPGF
jgi:hypothetical protein